MVPFHGHQRMIKLPDHTEIPASVGSIVSFGQIASERSKILTAVSCPTGHTPFNDLDP